MCFANAQPIGTEQTRVFISSADWMPRNFYSRVETLVEITDKTAQHKLLNIMMMANIKDSAQSWILQANGEYERINQPEEKGFSAQNYFMENPNLSNNIIVS